MNDDEPAVIQQVVRDEIAKGQAFSNFHGITADNLEAFLVPPFEIMVDPDDLETQIRPMWVVLQVSASPKDGQVIVYDPDGHWGVAEHVRDGDYVLVTAAPSLAEALDGM
jgi:hypothetical protein